MEMCTEDQIKFEQRCNQEVLDLYVVKTSNMVHHESDIKIINNLLEDLYLSRYIMKKHNYVFTKKTLKMIKQLSCVFENYCKLQTCKDDLDKKYKDLIYINQKNFTES